MLLTSRIISVGRTGSTKFRTSFSGRGVYAIRKGSYTYSKEYGVVRRGWVCGTSHSKSAQRVIPGLGLRFSLAK